MGPNARRAWIALDEWLGAALLLYLWRTHDPAFWPVLAWWALCVYGVSYPLHWLALRRERRKPRARPP